MTYYDILEISPSASEDVIRMAYKALAKKYHPDVFAGDKAVAEKKMKEINEAYEILSDATKRKTYDSTLKCNTTNHESAYNAQRDNTTSNNQQANDKQAHTQTVQNNTTKKVPFFFQWKFIIPALFVFSGTENSILIFVGLALAVIRFVIGLIKPQYKLHGFKKLAAFVCCTLAILSVIGALSPDTPNNNTFLDTDTTTQSTNNSGSNETEDNSKETILVKVVTDVDGYTSLKKYDIENVYGIYDGKILIDTSDSDEYMCIDIASGKVIEKFTGSIKDDAFENGYIGYYDYEKSENIIKKIDGSKVVLPDSEYRIVEELFEEEIFIISRQRTDYEYSGYELAAVSFSGEIVMDWIAPPIDGVIIDVLCHDMGEGIIYLGEDNYPSFQDEQGTSYFLNVYTGKTFQWPEDAPRLDKIIRGTDPSLISTFKNGCCIGYRNCGPYTTATEYFRFDLQNGYQVLSNIGGGETPIYVQGAGMFYQYGYLGAWSDEVKWSIYDMTGKEAFDTSNYTIQSFNAFFDCFGLIVSSANGNQNANFFTVVNLEGEELFAPINCTGMIVRQFNDDKIFCLIDGEKATFYNYDGDKIGDIGIITETEKGLIFSSKQTYTPIDIEIIDGYIVGCFVNEKGNQRHFIGNLDYSEKELIIEQDDSDVQMQQNKPTAIPNPTTSSENNTSTNNSTGTGNPNGANQSEKANQELSSFWGKWILDEEWCMQFSEGYFSSSYQDGPLRVDNYYFEDGKLHIYFSLDPFDTGYVWGYYGVMDGNTLALSMDGEGGYGAPELYYKEGSSAPDIGTLGDIKEHGDDLCGYDYNGSELYVGYVVRIGANHEGTQYALGTIVGWTDVGTVQVKFTDVLAVEEYGQTDPYFIEGITDEIAQNGESIRFVDSRTLQILIFG